MANREPAPWIFPSEVSTPRDYSRVANTFRWLLPRAGLPRFRPYDLRHTHATQLLESGAPITYVAHQLGHAKPTTTLAYYAHWLPRDDRTYIDRLIGSRTAVAPVAPPETVALPASQESESVRPWHQSDTESESGTPSVPEVPDSNGEP